MKSLSASAASAHSYHGGPAVTPARAPAGKGPSLTGQPQQMCGWSFLPTEQENYRPRLTGASPPAAASAVCRRREQSPLVPQPVESVTDHIMLGHIRSMGHWV